MEIACIVEGDGEERALPRLVRRIVSEIDATIPLQVYTALRWPNSRLVKREHLMHAVDVAARGLREPGGLLIVIDADNDCPATIGPRLLRWALEARSDIPVAVVLANREFEGWFLASADSLRGRQGLAESISPPPDPEAIRGAKAWLDRHRPKNHPYDPVVDQEALVRYMDLEQARRAPSFDKLCRDVRRLVDGLRSGPS